MKVFARRLRARRPKLLSNKTQHVNTTAFDNGFDFADIGNGDAVNDDAAAPADNNGADLN